jgi:hypothetical protein
LALRPRKRSRQRLRMPTGLRALLTCELVGARRWFRCMLCLALLALLLRLTAAVTVTTLIRT